MRTNKLLSILCLTACVTAALCMTGCSTDCNVTVKNTVNEESYTLTVKEGETVTMNTVALKFRDKFLSDTGMLIDENLYTDKDCLTKFNGLVNGNITLYFGTYDPRNYGKVVFEYNDDEYVVYREAGTTLTVTDFSRSAYGIGDAADYAFYSDEAHTAGLNISEVTVKSVASGGMSVIYVADVYK